MIDNHGQWPTSFEVLTDSQCLYGWSTFPWSPMSSSVSSSVSSGDGGGSRLSKWFCNNTVKSNTQDMWINLIYPGEVVYKPPRRELTVGDFLLRVYSQCKSIVHMIQINGWFSHILLQSILELLPLILIYITVDFNYFVPPIMSGLQSIYFYICTVEI